MILHPDFNRLAAIDHLAGLRRDAQRFRLVRAASARPARTVRESIQLRVSACRTELERLAALSEKRLVAGDWLVAEVDGVPVAALSLEDGTTLADPFKPTKQVVSLLQLRARQVATAH